MCFYFIQKKTVIEQNGDSVANKDEISTKKDPANEIVDIEEAVPKDNEDKDIDKQRFEKHILKLSCGYFLLSER